MYLTLLGVAYGVIATKDLYDGILIIPLTSLALYCRYLQDSAVIAAISSYIHDEIEGRKIPALIGAVPTDDLETPHPHQKLWQAWSHYYNWRFRDAQSVYKAPLFILFFLLSIVPACWLAITNLSRLANNKPAFSQFSPEIVGYVMGPSLGISLLIGLFILVGLTKPFYWVNTKS